MELVMKFTELVSQVAKPIASYRQIIFKTFIIALSTGGSSNHVSGIFRRFSDIFGLTGITRKRLPLLKELGKQLKEDAETDRIHIYGKERDCTFSQMICMSKALKCKIKVVLIYRNSYIFPIFTTDLTLTAQQMIEYYSARWKIESGFKELKHAIGILDSQCRKEQAVENHFVLAFSA
jgi:transposase